MPWVLIHKSILCLSLTYKCVVLDCVDAAAPHRQHVYHRDGKLCEVFSPECGRAELVVTHVDLDDRVRHGAPRNSINTRTCHQASEAEASVVTAFHRCHHQRLL